MNRITKPEPLLLHTYGFCDMTSQAAAQISRDVFCSVQSIASYTTRGFAEDVEQELRKSPHLFLG